MARPAGEFLHEFALPDFNPARSLTRPVGLAFWAAAALFVATPVAAQAPPTPEKGDEIIFGCAEGEGCGCSGATQTSKKFRLYELMNASSKLLGDYAAPVAAKPGDSFSLVKEPGRYKVTALRKRFVGLKVGDTVDRLFSHGEGVMQAQFNGKKFIFEGDDLSLKTIVPTKVETWYQVSVGALHGYSRTFPFKTCFEGPDP